MSGCGGHCHCTGMASGDVDMKETCAAPKETITLDKEGKCPCGKELKDCCHKEEISGGASNDALDELCGPHGDAMLCGDEDEDEKTASLN